MTGLILLFSYRTSLGTGAVRGPGSRPAEAPSIVPPASASSAPGAPARAPTMTVNGTVARTRWGPVQVQISVSGATVTSDGYVESLQAAIGAAHLGR